MMMASSNQPKALRMLFFTEMWERFSYYGMRALLVLYLVNALKYDRDHALSLYAIYTGLVYITPIMGGYIADHLLGTRKSIFIGGITMALGHFAMAFPSLLYLALGLLIIGNGFFKPNISSLLGSLYEKNDSRRDGGFILFYIGINLGAFLSPLVAGTLGEQIGWHWGFASAGIGMVIGLITFLNGQKNLGNAGLTNGNERLGLKDSIQIMAISLAAIPLVYLIIQGYACFQPVWNNLSSLSRTLSEIASVTTLWFLGSNFGKSHPALTNQEWKQILFILILGLFVIFFWMGFEQAGGTMNLFADQKTNRFVGNWEIPSSYFQSINPLVIILLGPVFATLWSKLDRSKFAFPTTVKMAIGMIFLGLGFIVLAIADSKSNLSKVGPEWLLIVYFLHTIGELCLSPIGLSMVTNIAPARLASMLLGIWYLSNAIANYLAGTLEHMLASADIPVYWFLVVSSIGSGMLLLFISPFLNRLVNFEKN